MNQLGFVDVCTFFVASGSAFLQKCAKMGVLQLFIAIDIAGTLLEDVNQPVDSMTTMNFMDHRPGSWQKISKRHMKS